MHEDTEPQQEGCYLPGTGFNRDRYVQRPYFYHERPAPMLNGTTRCIFGHPQLDTSTMTMQDLLDLEEELNDLPYQKTVKNGMLVIDDSIDVDRTGEYLVFTRKESVGKSSRTATVRKKIHKEIDDSINNDTHKSFRTLDDIAKYTENQARAMDRYASYRTLTQAYIEDQISENLEMIGSNKIPKTAPTLPTQKLHRESYQEVATSNKEAPEEEPLYLANLTDELRAELQSLYDKTFPGF